VNHGPDHVAFAFLDEFQWALATKPRLLPADCQVAGLLFAKIAML